MSRHLGTLRKPEQETLHAALVEWLEAHDVAGAVADHYSLYGALNQEYEKATAALARAQTLRLEDGGQ